MSKKREIVYANGSRGESGDFPIAVIYTQEFDNPDSSKSTSPVVDPIFTSQLQANLYGRIMTIVEATTDEYKLKSVKDLFGKELQAWSSDVFHSAQEIANGGNSSYNLYTRYESLKEQ